MEIPLPQPIETFVRAENSGDVDAMSSCFAPFATVRDENRFVEGLPAIKAWRARKKKQQAHTLTPIAVRSSNGGTTMKAELRGNFVGSPMTADFYFVLVNDQIASLQIRT